MGPAEPVRPVYSAPGKRALGAGKTARPAKRVALATRVASPPGISRSVGNKNSSEIHIVTAYPVAFPQSTKGYVPSRAPKQPRTFFPVRGCWACFINLLKQMKAGCRGCSHHTEVSNKDTKLARHDGMSLAPATLVAEAGESLEPPREVEIKVRRDHCVTGSSLSNRARLRLKKKKRFSSGSATCYQGDLEQSSLSSSYVLHYKTRIRIE
ncbi:hypothetical protein AAY473_030564 [Plecturocebus cupreus]